MRHLLQVFLALLVCVSAAPVQKKSTRETVGLIGAVHTVRLESFAISKTTGKEEPLYGAWIYTYNRDGYKTEADDFAPDGSLTRQIFNTYDEMNRLTEELDYFVNGSLRKKTICTYKNDSKTAEAAVFKSDGSLSYRVLFAFPDDYDLSEVTQLLPVSFQRESGWLEAAQYDSSGTLIQKYTAVNKNSRREITRTSNDPREGLRTSEGTLIYTYDVNGTMTSRSLLVNGTALSTGPARVEEQCSSDSEGNWTRMVITSPGETRVEYRTITYY